MINVVWFRRDLRITDHRPLFDASQYGETLPIFIVEPSFWQRNSYSFRHYQFVLESLADLQASLSSRGGKLFVAIAESEQILEALLDRYGPFNLYAHEELGDQEATARIQRVRQWMTNNSLRYYEYPAFAEAKRQTKTSTVDNKELVCAPSVIRLPELAPPAMFTDSLKKLHSYHVKGAPIHFGQQGGEVLGHETLTSFLDHRYQSYLQNRSHPLGSSASCSRLSPYIAWGNLSVNEIINKTFIKMHELETEGMNTKELKAFLTAIHKRQTLIQHVNTHVGESFYPEDVGKNETLERFFQGQTGIPFVDAALRYLHKTGWLNDQMRTMIAFFACRMLEIDYQQVSSRLAQLFLDYEPRVHHGQMRMQSRELKSSRVFHPIKIGKQLDPDGTFIRRYVPELAVVPTKYVHEPWMYPAFYSLGIPTPLIDVDKAARMLKKRYETTAQTRPDFVKEPGLQTERSINEQLTLDLNF